MQRLHGSGQLFTKAREGARVAVVTVHVAKKLLEATERVLVDGPVRSEAGVCASDELLPCPASLGDPHDRDCDAPACN